MTYHTTADDDTPRTATADDTPRTATARARGVVRETAVCDDAVVDVVVLQSFLKFSSVVLFIVIFYAFFTKSKMSSWCMVAHTLAALTACCTGT